MVQGPFLSKGAAGGRHPLFLSTTVSSYECLTFQRKLQFACEFTFLFIVWFIASRYRLLIVQSCDASLIYNCFYCLLHGLVVAPVPSHTVLIPSKSFQHNLNTICSLTKPSKSFQIMHKQLNTFKNQQYIINSQTLKY